MMQFSAERNSCVIGSVLSLLQKYREIFEETNFAPKYFSF